MYSPGEVRALKRRIAKLYEENEELRDCLRYTLSRYDLEFESNQGPDGLFPDNLTDKGLSKARRLADG